MTRRLNVPAAGVLKLIDGVLESMSRSTLEYPLPAYQTTQGKI